MKVGGASGPLYGTLFIALGKEIAPDGSNLPPPSAGYGGRQGPRQVAAGTEDDARRADAGSGRSREGGGDLTSPSARGRREAADATVPMLAIRGRASFLGERSIGHMDPGARSIGVDGRDRLPGVEGLKVGEGRHRYRVALAEGRRGRRGHGAPDGR